jgi:catechol 2,3-dioxygenase-like lactoylglutathione lyase family enzyme
MAKRASAKKSVPSLGSSEAIATVAVTDLKKARKFYEGTLGLEEVSSEGEEAVNYRTGDSQLLVYRSEYAGTNEATAATWVNADVDGLVAELKSRGVSFERYDMPDAEHEGDVHVFGEMRAAWFKDPDGNILAIVSD